MAKYKGSHKRRYTNVRRKGSKGASARAPMIGVTLKKLGQRIRRAQFNV